MINDRMVFKVCGRFQISIEFALLLARYGFKISGIDFLPKDEVYPSDTVPVVINQGGKQLSMLKWGFSPSFAKRPIINARSETIDIKPTFKSSFFNRRCLIPATGFFEWEKKDGKKIKRRIQLDDEEIFSMAGIYNEFIDKQGNPFKAFTILTITPNKSMERIHDRMPVIIDKTKEDIWLDNNIRDVGLLKSLLKPYDGTILIA